MTYLYQTINEHDAVEAFHQYGRLQTDTTSGNFTANAVRALVEYYEELADDTGEPIQFDVAAWCCAWAQYDSIVGAAKEYDNSADVFEYLQAWKETLSEPEREVIKDDLLEWFRDQTAVIELDDGVLVQQF